MSDKLKFWEAIAPYLFYLEDNHLDLDSINKLMDLIDGPVLIVGAGQGLLVEELKKKGYTVDGVDIIPLMINYAKENFKEELYLESYPPELLENPYSIWPGTLYSWGFKTENPPPHLNSLFSS